MNIKEQFQKYAAAFEETYVDDDWSRLEPFFSEDATYEVRGMPLTPIHAKGRTAVFEALRRAINVFDRRFDSRKVQILAPPEVTGSTLAFPWSGTYGRAGVADLVIEGVEEAHYNDAGEIVSLVDSYGAGIAEVVDSWLAQHGGSLKSTAGSGSG
jgi:hypothetical protein